MTRKLSLLLVLALFLVSIVNVTVFAAKAKQASVNGADPNDRISAYTIAPLAGSEPVSFDPSIGKPGSQSSHQSLGFSPMIAGDTIGYTYQDYQHNGSMGRQIAIGGGWAHNIWMVLPAASTANRVVSYYGYPLAGGPPATVADLEGSTGSGYPNIGFSTAAGVPVVGFHNVNTGGVVSGRDFSLGAASFTVFVFPTANCQGIVSQGGTEGSYIWPTLAVDSDGGQAVVHLIASESTPAAGDKQSIVYYRSNAGITAPSATCGFWIDSVQTISPVIAADPNSNNVAIAYCKPRQYDTQVNSDMVYRESTDLGATWGPIINVSNYATGQIERAYTDCDAMYTADGCLHIAWNAPGFDSVAGTITSQAAKLRHWDDCNQCLSLALDANHFDPAGECGVWNKNVCKMNLSECTVGGNDLLYLTYTYFKSDSSVAGVDDVSLGGYKNGDIYAQASNTDGETWGPPVNLTNTTTNNCAAGACKSEHWSSSAMYVTDSLRIQYVEDKDAGGIVQTEGTWTNSPIRNMSAYCFPMTSFVSLGATPAEFRYPYTTTPGQIKNETITLANSGNSSANWSVTATGGFITFPVGPSNGICPAGCTNTSTFQARITGPGTQGLYQGTIDVNYTSPDKGAQAIISIPFDLYNFTNFYLPQNSALRTNINKMNVNQASQISANIAGSMFSYFADTTDYLYEGHLVIGNDVLNLSYSIFGGSGAPSLSNPYGYTYAATATMPIDSTTFGTYRVATGKGVNRDTTIGFDVKWYSSKHPDSGDFYVGQFKVYKGAKNPAGTISNVSLAYYTDWDVPDDSSQNDAGFDASRAAVWQKGNWSVADANRYGATAAYRDDGNDIVGGWVLDNPTYIYPDVGYDNDSLWAIMETLTQGTYRITDSLDDLSGGILIHRDLSINGAANDTAKFVVVIAGTRTGGLSGLNLALDKAKAFICGLDLAPGADICSSCLCGDANGSGSINISDAVFIINYIFAGGAAPNPLCLGDANGTGSVNISDAVYIINFIFGGGPTPHCP